jgi:hypothetical protein
METQTDVPTSGAERIPRSPLGKRLLEIRQKIVASGRPLLDWEDMDRETAEQRGKQARQDERCPRRF